MNDAEFKVMGLAAYGRDIYGDKMKRMINLDEDGKIGESNK